MRIPRSGNLRAIGVCAAIAVGGSLGILAPPAIAAPANDNFANRADLGDALPVQIEESNAGATADGSPEVGSFAAGHSIWWKWEAPTTQWTTVDTCDSSFLTVLGIFEGTELTHLRRTVEGNASEGPRCRARGTTDTFFAEAGKSYDIAVDGNGFHLPEAPRPSGEGLVKLSIEATPPPPNDDFADATPISASVDEEPGGRRIYRTQSTGYDWGATGEAGEPPIGDGVTGTSVWYSWTPPESGEASINACCSAVALGLFTGNSVTGLTAVPTSGAYPQILHAYVVGGTEYTIGVAATEDQATGEPTMTSFNLQVGMELTPGPGFPWKLTGEDTVVPPRIPLAPTAYTSNAPLGSSPATSTPARHRKKHHRKDKKRRHHRRLRAHHRAARHHAAG